MGKLIQMIPTSESNSIFIEGYNDDKDELTFRSGHNITHKMTEVVKIKGNMVYAGMYNFHINYLYKFLKENANE